MAEAANFDTQIDAKGNITTKRADDFDLETQFIHEDDSTPHDLTQYTDLVASVKTKPEEPTYVMQFTLVDGFSVSANLLTWHKSATEMMIASGTYVYDIEATKSGGVVTTIASGSFIVTSDVTRDGDTPTP